jgi:hypothetical protein
VRSGSIPVMDDAVDRFARALTTLESELDWDVLGRLYCWEGGEEFFPPEQVAAIGEAGLVVASALAEELARGGVECGRSLYIGAAVAELVPMLCEHLVLGREVVATNLPGEERTELNRALLATERATGIDLPRIDTESLDAVSGVFDHGWIVSVINDPEAFPALHDRLYGREVGSGDLGEERLRAGGLVSGVLERLTAEALLTTTDEELPVIGEIAVGRGWGMAVSERGLLTAVVGDPLRFVRLSRGSGG